MTDLSMQEVHNLRMIAKAIGISDEEFKAALEGGTAAALIAERRTVAESSDWLVKMRQAKARRKRMAGAYLVGASQTQLAKLLGVTTQSIQAAISKEIPAKVRQKIATERVGHKSIWKEEEISVMMGLNEQTVLDTPILLLAAKMSEKVKEFIIASGDLDPANQLTRLVGEATEPNSEP